MTTFITRTIEAGKTVDSFTLDEGFFREAEDLVTDDGLKSLAVKGDSPILVRIRARVSQAEPEAK